MAEAENLNVVITGSSSGFGKLTAETLAREGCRVFATMREVQGKNAEPARELVALAEREGVNIDIVEMDVTDEVSVERAVRSIIGAARTIDVLVNNAGIDAAGILEAFTVKQAQAVFDLNTFGPLRVNRAVLTFSSAWECRCRWMSNRASTALTHWTSLFYLRRPITLQ